MVKTHRRTLGDAIQSFGSRERQTRWSNTKEGEWLK